MSPTNDFLLGNVKCIASASKYFKLNTTHKHPKAVEHFKVAQSIFLFETLSALLELLVASSWLNELEHFKVTMADRYMKVATEMTYI